MNKEELKEQDVRLNKLCFDYQEKEKRIAELEQKISVLLSCKNCPENKDGLICRKEYENKCLAQKIQFIKELQQENAELKARLNAINQLIPELEKENSELKKIAEFQQSSNMTTHFENKKLKEVLAVGSTWNKALNSMNKSLEEERDKYRNMVFDKDEQLTKAKAIIKDYVIIVTGGNITVCSVPEENRCINVLKLNEQAEQFLKEVSE